MAAASSPSSYNAPRTRHTESFRPQFPVNPFGSHTLFSKPSSSSIYSTLNEPWLVKPDQAPFLNAYRRDVVLVLGTPSESCVAALLASHSLVHSLLIFASHCPPTIPSSHAPAVRVLRLTSQLAVEDAGAVRLVSILEWAERVARVWRASGSDDADVVYYDEATKDVPVTTYGSPPRNFSTTASRSVESLSKSFRSRNGLNIFAMRRLSTSSNSLLSIGSIPPVDPSQRPFDAILNYVSHEVTERRVLKQIILATSIARPFLSPTLSPYHKLSEAKKNSRRNSSSFMYALPPTPPYQPGDLSSPPSSMNVTPVLPASAMPPPFSHMVHIVPPTARVGLVRSLDSFLSSFSQQPLGPDEIDLAKQYTLTSSTMKETIIHPHFDQDECTVLDFILGGGLDSVSGKSWIGSGQDLLFLPTSGSSPVPSTSSISRKSIHSPSKTPPGSLHASFRTRVKSSPQLLSLNGGEPSRLPRSNSGIPEHSPVSNQDEFAFSNTSPRSHPLRHPQPQSPHQPSSLGGLSRKATRRSKLNVITHPDDYPSTSGLPTPPDSDEDSRQVSPRPRTPEVPIPRKRKLKWQFWKSS